MKREEIRQAMESLAATVAVTEENGAIRIRFERPTREGLLALGVTGELADRISRAAWLDEMTTDVIETPEFCDPGAGAEEVLGYARDVVREYVRKRL